MAEGKIAEDSVPLAGEADCQSLGDIERSVGVYGEQRVEVPDANRAALRARITRKREDPNQERERATNR